MAVASSLPALLVNIIQSNYLQRMFQDALRPIVLYRREAIREQLKIEAGQSMTMTRRGLITPDVTPLTPGVDPGTADYAIEQYTVSPQPYGKSKDTHLPASAVAIVNKFIEDAKSLAEHSGWTVDRLARNALYRAYMSGQTLATAAGTTVTTIPVDACNGFTVVVDVNGKEQPVSAANPLAITIGGTANTVIGTQPQNATFPWGPGNLLLGTSATWVNRAIVLASNAPVIVRPPSRTNDDAIISTDVVTFAMLLQAVRILRANRVPTFADGTYHMHWAPEHIEQALNDSALRQLFQGQPDTREYREGILVKQLGITFLTNTDNPSTGNVGASPGNLNLGAGSALQSFEVGGLLVNQAGIPIRRSILIGDSSLRECYIPEERYMEQTEGRLGPFGYTGQFLENGGFEAIMEGIRYIVRPPLDKLMNVVSQTWSVSADWVAPPDNVSTTSTARYKRGVVLATA